MVQRIAVSWSPRVCAGGSEVEVGVVHNVFWTEPKRHGLLYTHVRCAPHLCKARQRNATITFRMMHQQ